MVEVADAGAGRAERGERSSGRRRPAGAKSSRPTRKPAALAGSADATASERSRTVKKSVTLRETVAEEIEARTGARGFSQFLDAAAERYLALLKAQELVDDHTSRHGEFTKDELAEAEAAWRGR